MITILAYYDRISVFHTIAPFFLKKYRRLFHFTQSLDFCLKHDKNKTLFMERLFLSRDPRDLRQDELDALRKLRDKYETIVFFNGQPEAGPNKLDVLPFVDRFFDKSVFSNREYYQKPLYGKNLFADYYHKQYGVIDEKEYLFKPSVSSEDAKRVELSWNIGVDGYPRRDFPQRLGAVVARAGFPYVGRLFKTQDLKKPTDFSGEDRNIAVHARIDPVTCPSIAYQRVLFLQKIAEKQAKETFLTGLTSQNQYYRELSSAKITLSPFGWGEVCHRDFEAVIFGSLLLKPDMSHIKTYPDVYIPYETYIPLDWDGRDLFEKVDFYLANTAERQRIAQNAFERYQKELSGLEDRFGELFENRCII
ncbi:MAG: glycosyltransferase [Treponema sp.]|jgi:hypothetical protein|nr:glycosyltransferase [Treponema sp.]